MSVPATAPVPEGSSDDPLGVPGAVGVGRVHERHAEVRGGAQCPDGLVVIDRSPAELARTAPRGPTQGPRADSEGRHADATAAEGADHRADSRVLGVARCARTSRIDRGLARNSLLWTVIIRRAFSRWRTRTATGEDRGTV